MNDSANDRNEIFQKRNGFFDDSSIFLVFLELRTVVTCYSTGLLKQPPQ